MNAEEFNRKVEEALRNEPLRGVLRIEEGSDFHHWEISSRRAADPEQRRWRLFVSPGAVNDKVAAITYLRDGDPRGWIMPEDHPGIAMARRLYGSDFKLVDRLLTEREDPPHLLLTAPAEDGSDLGDFRRIEDAQRITPAFFRSAEMWELELYRASLFLTAQPQNFSYVENRLRLPVPTRNARFRLAVASRLPVDTEGVATGGQLEIARLFLTRDPRARSPIVSDTLYVQPRRFWSFWTANAEPDPFGNFAATFGSADPTGAIEAITAAAFAAIGADLAAASSVEFWSAA